MRRLSGLALLPLLLAAGPALAAGSHGTTTTVKLPTLYSWMSPDLSAAWKAGYEGQGTTVTMVDEFSGRDPFSGDFNGTWQTQLHGLWTTEEVSLIAPDASIIKQNFNIGGTVRLYSGLNVINASYAMYAASSVPLSSIRWASEESSMIRYAQNGQALIVKAAGNDSVAVGTAVKTGTYAGYVDDFDAALIGAQSALFVGALNSNGTTLNKASLASYSDTAGSNTTVQAHFLVVGVDGAQTDLYGTSFAAPVISGYAAIIGSKFKTASATAIADDLLSTARKDTLVNYNAATYGQGEASLANALAPVSIK